MQKRSKKTRGPDAGRKIEERSGATNVATATSLLNKLKPLLSGTVVRVDGREGRRGRGGKGVEWDGFTAHPGVTAGILLTSAQRRRAAHFAAAVERKRSRPRPRQTAK